MPISIVSSCPWHQLGEHLTASAILCLLVALNGAAGAAPTLKVATASLALSAPGGSLRGEFTLKFERAARVYDPERFGLAPTVNYWLKIELESASGVRFHLVPDGAVPLWPTKEGVRTVAAGEKIVVELELSPEAGFALETEDHKRVERLPAGKYLASARFSVDDSYPARRCGLTVFSAEARPVDLVVDDVQP